MATPNLTQTRRWTTGTNNNLVIAAIVAALLLHAILLAVLPVPHTPIPNFEKKSEKLTLKFASEDLQEILVPPALLEEEPKAKQPKEIAEPDQLKTIDEKTTVDPLQPEEPAAKIVEEQKTIEEQQDKKKEPQPEPEKKPEEPEPATPAPEDFGNAAPPSKRMVNDSSTKEETPPENTNFVGVTNTQAANPNAPKELPVGPAPFKPDGDTGLVAEINPAGEKKNRDLKPFPTTGSVEREGTPELGQPTDPGQGLQAIKTSEEKFELPSEKPIEKIVEKPTESALKAVAETKAKEKLEGPESPLDELLLDKKGEVPIKTGDGSPALKDTAPENPLGPVEDIALAKKRIRTGGSDLPDLKVKTGTPEIKDLQQPGQKNDLLETPKDKSDDLVQTKKDAVQNKPAEDIDPELQRLEALMNRVEDSSSAPEMEDDQNIGLNRRKGELGHEGDGTAKVGDALAISDVVTINLSSRAENIGDFQFGKRFDAESVYLKPYFTRINSKWKAELMARNRTRLSSGSVGIKITLANTGKLLKVEVLKADSGLSSTLIKLCKDAVFLAGEHDPFPANLKQKPTLSTNIIFHY